MALNKLRYKLLAEFPDLMISKAAFCSHVCKYYALNYKMLEKKKQFFPTPAEHSVKFISYVLSVLNTTYSRMIFKEIKALFLYISHNKMAASCSSLFKKKKIDSKGEY